MINGFVKKPFKERLKDTAYLLKNSFKVVSMDRDIIKPAVHMVVFSVIFITLVFISLLFIFTGAYPGWGIVLLLFLIFVLTPFKFFYYIRQKADQSWIVYNAVIGGDISYSDAHRHTKLQKSNLRKIALIEMLMAYVKSQKNNKEGGLGRFLINMFIAGLVEVWDLLSHYMIPAVVIEQKPLKQIIPQVKSLRNNVPATLVGVFGIDFVGNVLNSILLPVYLLVLLISVGIGVVAASFASGTVLTFGGFSFSWVPVVVGLYLVFVIGAIFKKLVECVKVIYFTVFYTAITDPSSIIKDMRTELTHYLRMGAGKNSINK